MKVHDLKTTNPHFQELYEGNKTFEIRKNDRDFQAGDYLRLNEWNGQFVGFSGRTLIFKVTHILFHEDYPVAIKEGYCVMSLSK